ncbi:AmmeMemoRadiSam system protein A [Treponema socranskii subsp. buccale]|uniref:AmmeMemoRadiSam system protein A n=1 Tax=Treponema socranskii TaxID=53419 RepID=UPI0020A46053|nr:AmmeMemoRadiSam system protein A [Treponema socranskii]UTD03301.1 AmmeMemoRadiSam system protein A [Treponema socranskii subsp. buccale]
MAIIGAFTVPHPPLIVHEVGKGRENEIAATIAAYVQVAKKIANLKPETIVVTSPHAPLYRDYFHISPGTEAFGDFSDFGAAEVRFHLFYDADFVKALCSEADKANIAAGTKGEKRASLDHGTMVPLYFINKYYTDYKLVRIGLSGQSYKAHYALGECIRRAAEKTGKSVVVVASGDLSHVLKSDGPYGYRAEGPVYDERIMDVMESADFGKLFSFSPDFCENAAECGHRSFIIMAGSLDRTAVRAEKLSYEGPFGVGYGICAYEVTGRDDVRNFLERYEAEERRSLDARKRNEDEYVRLARLAVENYVRTKGALRIEGGAAVSSNGVERMELSDDLLKNRAGVFVSLKKDGMLRGCIGTIAPVRESIAQEIAHNAISAAAFDPRFSEVTEDELSSLVYSVDVLSSPEKISSKEALDVKRYGVIVTKGNRRGLLLPNLETVNTVDEQIEIACKKGGIDKSENPELERFEVVRHY